MAEERISINFMPDNPCNGCEVKLECPFDCPEKAEYNRSITRAEAIERMAKAMYAEVWKSKTPMVRVQNWEIGVNEQNKNKYRKQAQAALDALLGGK